MSDKLDNEIKDSYDHYATADARREFASLAERAKYDKERIVVTKNGRPAFALIPIQDLKKLVSIDMEVDKAMDRDAENRSVDIDKLVPIADVIKHTKQDTENEAARLYKETTMRDIAASDNPDKSEAVPCVIIDDAYLNEWTTYTNNLFAESHTESDAQKIKALEEELARMKDIINSLMFENKNTEHINPHAYIPSMASGHHIDQVFHRVTAMAKIMEAGYNALDWEVESPFDIQEQITVKYSDSDS